MREEQLQVILLIVLGMPVPLGWMIKLLKAKRNEIDDRRTKFDEGG